MGGRMMREGKMMSNNRGGGGSLRSATAKAREVNSAQVVKRAGRAEILDMLLSVANELDLPEGEMRELTTRLALLLRALQYRGEGMTVAGAFRWAGTEQ